MTQSSMDAVTSLNGDTARRIVDVATDLIQTRGYSAISYQFISDRLGIRNASIHYHFPAKADLGVAVVKAYAETHAHQLGALLEKSDAQTAALLDNYFAGFRALTGTPGKVCLCAALASEILALPAQMRAPVKDFFAMHEAWLEKVLRRGQKRAEVPADLAPAKAARTIFSGLQGAVLVGRATGNRRELDDVIATIRATVLAKGRPARRNPPATGAR